MVVDLEHLGHFNFLCFKAQAGKAARPVYCSLSTRNSIELQVTLVIVITNLKTILKLKREAGSRSPPSSSLQ